MLYINDGVANVNFCQIVGNTFKSTEIYCQSGKTDINNNWWGSNNDPSFHVNSNINITTWMVLHIIISPNKVLYGENSTVTADILFDNLNNYLDPVNGHVPDGVMVNYSSNVGGFYQSYNYLINGIAESIFTAKTVGKGNISVIVDDQTINSPITIDPLPTVTATPKGGLYNQTQSVRLKMNKAGIIYYTLNGSLPTTSSKKYTGPISITTTAVLKYIAIDLSNNQSPVYTQKYIIDRIAPKITTTTPKNNSTGYPRTKNITINFTKNITNSINYNNITIKNLHTGKTLILTKTITKNLLTLKTSTLSSSTWYQVIIPKASIKDLAGNKLTTTYTFKFKTRG